MKRLSCVFALLLLMSAFFIPICPGQNLRRVFSQIAAGDSFTTTIQLVNKGADTFRGSLAVVDDNGFFLPVQINGVSVTDFYDLTIPARSTHTLQLSRTGAVLSGHVLIWDMQPEGVFNLEEHLSGTAIFQWRNGAVLIDSVGVPTGDGLEHFFFSAEYSNEVSTGLAISNAEDATVTVTLKAFSETGTQIGSNALTLEAFQHTAFFVNEVLPLPLGFRGTIDIEADDIVYPLVLRAEGNQFSTVTVSPMPAIYDFTIFLDDGRQFQGKMSFAVRSASLAGIVYFTNPRANPDRANIITGAAGKGLLLTTTFFESGQSSALVEILSSGGFSTRDKTIGGTVFWFTDFGNSVGTFTAVKQN